MTRAIIQARMGSKRLRGKSLIPVAGIPLLKRVVGTVKQLPFIDEVYIATTILEEDDTIEILSNEYNVKCFRGDSLNVLKRYADAASDMDEKDNIVRITADNPFNWLEVSQCLYDIHEDHGNDYTCIDGLSKIVCEVIRVRALKEAAIQENLSPFDKEHVTPYFRKNKKDFKTQFLPPDFQGIRHDLDRFLTIDTLDDMYRMEGMIRDLKIGTGRVPFKDIYNWLDHNELHIKPDTIHKQTINLAGTPVGDKYPTFIVAEIGQNHNGEVKLAKKLIDMGVRCGANAVKFTKRDIPSELSKEAYDKIYDNPNSFGVTYGKHREFLELDEEQHLELKEYATARGITYFCTPCDIPSLELMERIGTPFYKVASRDLTNIPLLEAMGRLDKPVIISTGMATYEDIDDAVRALNLPKDMLAILQCTSEYPCKLENVNLNAMITLREKYGYLVGFSDHTSGLIVSAVAPTMGACIIEKHVTLDRTMKGTDQPGSLEEAGLKKLVEYIRATELARGDSDKQFNPVVNGNKHKLSKSLTSIVDIPGGIVLTEDMICLKSPGNGIHWRDRNTILGKKTKNNIKADVTLNIDDFE